MTKYMECKKKHLTSAYYRPSAEVVLVVVVVVVVIAKIHNIEPTTRMIKETMSSDKRLRKAPDKFSPDVTIRDQSIETTLFGKTSTTICRFYNTVLFLFKKFLKWVLCQPKMPLS